MNISNIYNKCINRVKEILPKNMKKEKIEYIENVINKILEKSIYDDFDKDIYDNKLKELKKENTQLRLDYLKIHEENKKLHKIIQKLDDNNKELRESNDELIKIAEEFEKINLNGNVGIYTEE